MYGVEEVRIVGFLEVKNSEWVEKEDVISILKII